LKTLLVDADACPVKSEALDVALRNGWSMALVSNGGIRPVDHPLVQNIYVGAGLDVADDWIAEHAGPGDLVITSDIPLAARCVSAGARVVKPDGAVLHDRNIGEALSLRNLMSDLRSADPFRQGGGRSFAKSDRSRFLDVLEREIRAVQTATKV
jgi:uncharacterized protein YaiI (UPF0178 family)